MNLDTLVTLRNTLLSDASVKAFVEIERQMSEIKRGGVVPADGAVPPLMPPTVADQAMEYLREAGRPVLAQQLNRRFGTHRWPDVLPMNRVVRSSFGKHTQYALPEFQQARPEGAQTLTEADRQRFRIVALDLLIRSPLPIRPCDLREAAGVPEGVKSDVPTWLAEDLAAGYVKQVGCCPKHRFVCTDRPAAERALAALRKAANLPDAEGR